ALAQGIDAAEVLGCGEQDAGSPPRRIEADRCQAGRQAERMAPGRLAGREHLAGVHRLGELQRPAKQGLLGGRQALGERAERRGAVFRVQLDDGDHALFYEVIHRRRYDCIPQMGWLTDWRRKRVLSRHRIDDALWKAATGGLTFLPAGEKLKSLVLLFLAEK